MVILRIHVKIATCYFYVLGTWPMSTFKMSTLCYGGAYIFTADYGGLVLVLFFVFCASLHKCQNNPKYNKTFSRIKGELFCCCP